ncbi:MAG: VTT domain-containing protein [Bacilli bacterium]|nr:VTT domain-containing protein [Bacilli bacterium]
MTSIESLLNNIDAITESFLASMGIWGAIASCFLITVESILPILPVCVFITLIFYTFGNFIGFLISWIFTCLGCLLSFTLFRTKIKNWFYRHFMKSENVKIKKFMKYVDDVSLSSLAVLVAIPFTPASVVNVAAGLSNMPKKKFIMAIMIGKLTMVYFWGYIGTTLIECLTHPVYLVKVLLLLVFALVISKVANKYLNVD